MSLASGARLGPYEILSAIGAGGMGKVYRARDTRLSREVAIKVLPPEFAANPERRHRFEQEARAVAALNHPHICQIYDVGPDYLVLELVDGHEIRGPSSEADAVRLALQITDALHAAHARGILHRDLKPSNVVVTADGQAKLLDFGIAKLSGNDPRAAQTVDGAVLGTVAYMSPEQAQGKPLDARSDIFSFGALLYELISGRRAFAADTDAAAFGAVLRDEPPPLNGAAPLERIVRKCLHKDPALRFQTASALKAALEPLTAAGPSPARSIAVLPFENMSGDKENEYFSDGLAEEIINSLAQIPGLKVIARTSAFAFKGKHQDIRRIAEALGVTTVLEGSVRKAGTRLRVTAQLITAADGSHLWSERYDRELTDVFAIQDDIATSIAAALKVTLGTGALRPRYTPTLPAYEALLRGRHFILSSAVMSQPSARVWLERAMKLDPGYAEPHASMGLSDFLLFMMGAGSHDVMESIRAAANQALALDPLEPSPHYLLGATAAAFEFDWDKAREHFVIATAGTASAEAHWAYASLYLQPLGKFDDAVVHMERAVDRDPLNAMWRGLLASHLVHAERYERAIEEATRAREIDATHLVPYTTLAEAYLTLGRWAEAIDALEAAYRVAPYFGLSTAWLAAALQRTGRTARAAELVGALEKAPRPPTGMALYHTLCGDFAAAADWYERAVEQRDPFALVFAAAPLTRELRQTPRWPRIAAMMCLPSRA
jgi:TolB-like protein/cytochrome c-type biogenesis protein CcmH/NrfG/predicted Ser/Thr protein kinase